MSRIFPLFCALVFTLFSSAADKFDALVQAANLTALTNFPGALALCDKAVADNPTNAMPLSIRARFLDRARRYDDAVRDLTAALKLDPKSAQFLQGRGEMNFKAGHFKESIADFDRVIELSPEQGPHHWQRGISLYYARRFSDGRKQFESHRTVNPNDVENATWHFICVAQESGVTNARAAMLPVGPDARVPMKQIDALYRGTGTVEQVIAAASASRSRDAMFYAHLYLGLYYDALGDVPKARGHITNAANDPGAIHYMGDVARVHLRTMTAR